MEEKKKSGGRQNKNGSKKMINAVLMFLKKRDENERLPEAMHIQKLLAPFMEQRGWMLVAFYVGDIVLVRMVKLIDPAGDGKLPDLDSLLSEFKQYLWEHDNEFIKEKTFPYAYQRFDHNWKIAQLAASTEIDADIFVAMILNTQVGGIPSSLENIKEMLEKMGEGLIDLSKT